MTGPAPLLASSPQTRPADLDDLDAASRRLYLRARRAGPQLVHVAAGVRRLRTALRHLRAEVDDPDSPLASPAAAGVVGREDGEKAGGGSGGGGSDHYARGLAAAVENCGFALGQVKNVLRHCASPEDGDGDDDDDDYDDDDDDDDDEDYEKEDRRRRLTEEERTMVAAIVAKLADEKAGIDMLLDAVQLYQPAGKRPVPVQIQAQGQVQPTDRRDVNLDIIKDKVDAIADRLYRDRDPCREDEEELWQRFRAELEAEGFSKEVLSRNKEVLRAYIREMDASLSQTDGAPPTVRGMLEQEERQYHSNSRYRPYPTSPSQSTPIPANHPDPDHHPYGGSPPGRHDSFSYPPSWPPAIFDTNPTYESLDRVFTNPTTYSSFSPSQYPPPYPASPPDAANPNGPATTATATLAEKEKNIPLGDETEKYAASVKREILGLRGQESNKREQQWQEQQQQEQQEGPAADQSPLLPQPKPMAPYVHHGALQKFHRQLSERTCSSSDDGYVSDPTDTLALISTQDLISQMGGMHLAITGPQHQHLHHQHQPQHQLQLHQIPYHHHNNNNHHRHNPSAPSQYHNLASPPPPFGPAATDPTQSDMALALSSSPNYGPPLLPFSQPHLQQSSTPPLYPATRPPFPPPASSALGPDNFGNEIPLNATWTRIKRTLISLEVLDQARVRYEARPDFVAILGILSRGQISDLARRSAECRAARMRAPPYYPRGRRGNERRWSAAAVGAGTGTGAGAGIGGGVVTGGSSNSSQDGMADDDLADEESDTTDDESATYEDEKNGGGGGKGSPPGTAAEPRSILKNKNDNRVHFDAEKKETRRGDDQKKKRPPPPPTKTTGAAATATTDRRRRNRDQDRDRGRDHKGGDRERDHQHHQHHPRSRAERDKEKDRDVKHHPQQRPHHSHQQSQSQHPSRGSNHRERDKDRDSDRDGSWERDREHGRRQQQQQQQRRDSNKKRWGETLGAVGIGGAAASLLSVLAEAAAAAF